MSVWWMEVVLPERRALDLSAGWTGQVEWKKLVFSKLATLLLADRNELCLLHCEASTLKCVWRNACTVIYLAGLHSYISFKLPCHIMGGSTKHLFRDYKICAEHGWYKTTSPASFSLGNRMFFTVLSDSRALFASSREQTACCCAALSQGCFLVGMHQVFLMQRGKTQSLEMPDLETLCGSEIWYLSKSENLVHVGLLFSRLYSSRVICWSALPSAGSFGNIEQQLWTIIKTGLFLRL